MSRDGRVHLVKEEECEGKWAVEESSREMELEPGACRGDTVLDAAETSDDLAAGGVGGITKIRGDVDAQSIDSELEPADDMEELSSSVSASVLQEKDVEQTAEEDRSSAPPLSLASHNRHLLVLSAAGKPIYSRCGGEERLAGLCGVIQALASVVESSGGDTLRSVRAGACRAVFLARAHLILVAVSDGGESDAQLHLQLTYTFNQIVSVLTLTQLNRILEQRRNYDLRRLLAGAERLLDRLLAWTERDPACALGAVRCLPLAPHVRDNVAAAVQAACANIRDLVFAILIAGDQLVTLVRMKKYSLHPADLHLVLNLVRGNESFKTAESWTPICLPKFDATGFLHGHVSYVSEESAACLLLLTVQRDAFYPLSKAKHAVAERLRRNHCLNAIDEALASRSSPLAHIGVPEMRHFMYKCKSTAQLVTGAGGCGETDARYLRLYHPLIARVHANVRPAKLIFCCNSRDTLLAWVTSGFELYVSLDPLVDKNAAILAVDRLLRWIKKEEERIFIMSAPTF